MKMWVGVGGCGGGCDGVCDGVCDVVNGRKVCCDGVCGVKRNIECY